MNVQTILNYFFLILVVQTKFWGLFYFIANIQVDLDLKLLLYDNYSKYIWNIVSKIKCHIIKAYGQRFMCIYKDRGHLSYA